MVKSKQAKEVSLHCERLLGCPALGTQLKVVNSKKLEKVIVPFGQIELILKT